MAKVLLIDGFNLAYRCFFAIPELTRKDGFPTNALHGWIKSLWRLTDQQKPDDIQVFFDLGGSHDRLALLPEYKAQRKEMPEALEKQIEPLKEITRAMGFCTIEKNGVESDDLLASKAMVLAREGNEVFIVSSDKDFAQLVGDHIKILLPPPSSNAVVGWRIMDTKAVFEKFGVYPEKIIDYLALVGDNADNIRGINGVGPKTAARWINQYGSLDHILANAAELNPERLRDTVLAGKDLLKRNLKLIKLNISIDVFVANRGEKKLEKFFSLLSDFEMKSTLVEARLRYQLIEFQLEY